MKTLYLMGLALCATTVISCSKQDIEKQHSHLSLSHLVTNVGDQGDRKSIQLFSDTTWRLRIEPQVSWLGLSTTAGKDSAHFHVIALQSNTTNQLRQTTVVAWLADDTLQKVRLTVYQHDSTGLK